MKEFDIKLINKWSPIVENYLKVNNTYFKYLCCHYLEFLSLRKNDISSDILELEKKTDLYKFRIKIVDYYFNILTGKVEYLLESGKIIDPDNYMDLLEVDDLVDIFGLDFLKEFDLSESREYKINKLYENR
jgi:hypothetical protein